jgi:diphosphomevalonate decarboxylase
VKILTKGYSNIALIKYMGKKAQSFDEQETKKNPFSKNRPTNASLSYTLPNLFSTVELELRKDSVAFDSWEPLKTSGNSINERREMRSDAKSFSLSEKSQMRFLSHFQFLKMQHNISKSFIIRSNNSFPQGCGLASSASSFAALTLAFFEYLKIETGKEFDLAYRAHMSSLGSGSSGRSFFGPWSIWSDKGFTQWSPKSQNFLELNHLAVVIESVEKKISSSEAHKKVISSLLFEGRPQRAEMRLSQLLESLEFANWRNVFELAWAEFWDMHALFETSSPSFGYMNEGSLWTLKLIRDLWEVKGDGPIVTMDAGPNIHLLFRNDQHEMKAELSKKIMERFQIIGEI